jgi:predicted transcriptional regulator of viral defense system
MASKGILFPIGSGSYAVAPDGARFIEQAVPFELALHARLSSFTEYYVSYMTAIIEHGLTDLDSENVYVAVRGSARKLEVAGRRVVATQITSERKWFGFERVQVDRQGHYFRADLERTLVDCLDRPRLCGAPEITVRAWERAFRQERIDLDRLTDYAIRLGRSATRRTAFWLAQLGQHDTVERLITHAGVLRAPVLLDSSQFYGDGDWWADRDFGVVVNVPEHAFHGWIAYAK